MTPPVSQPTGNEPDAVPVIELVGVGREFDDEGAGRVRALDDVSLRIRAGEFVCVTGPSGSGKTTLMNLLGCLDRPTSGKYRVAGTDVAALSSDDLARLRREVFGFVFQGYNLLESATARANVELPATYTRMGARPRRARARGILESIGLGDRVDHEPSELSGGEQQRVAIARALMNDAQVILADEPTGALDTAQGEGVLDLLEQLADRGHAVVLVSHDKTVADRAHRRIELADGRVVADADPSPAQRRSFDVGGAAFGGGVPWLGAVRSGLASMRRRRLAAALTVASVAAGVWSVLALLGLSEGVRYDSLETLERMGGNRLTVSGLDFDFAAGKSVRLPLALADAQAMREEVANLRAVRPRMNKRLPVQRETEVIDEVIIRATTLTEAKTWQNVSWPLEGGTYLTPQDGDDLAQVAVIGPTVRKRLFTPDENPIGALVHIDGLPFVVKGVLTQHPRMEGEGQAFVTADTSYEWPGTVIHVPFMTGADVLFGTDQLNMIQVVVDDVSRIDETSAAIRDFMFRRHGREGYSVSNQASIILAHKGLSAIHVAIFGTVAGVSLLVGGIGIVAVSLAAVNQRRREIGIRMAVGARRRDITAQFVVETSVATAIGGAVGALMGFAGSPLLAHVAGAPVTTTPWFLIVALACAVASGLVFGIAPARRAARLDPVAALAMD